MKAAVAQVKGYQTRLLAKYGSTLTNPAKSGNLRTYAVVALGFERVVWQEVPPPKSASAHLAIETKQ